MRRNVILILLVIPMLAIFPCCKKKVLPPAAPAVARPKSGEIKECDEWFARDFSPERQLLASIRTALAGGTTVENIPQLNIPFDPACSAVGVTLFQEGEAPLRWISKEKSLSETVNRIVVLLRKDKRFSSFAVSEAAKCRIMLEVIVGEEPLDISKLNTERFDINRFEPGVTGFRALYNGQSYYYTPTDAVVNSQMQPRDALNLLSKRMGLAEGTSRISERIKLLKDLPISFYTVESVAFVSWGDGIIPLYRGYPMPVEFSREKIFEMANQSVEWAYKNMRPDGTFLYYYDGVKDTVIDHTHPARTEEDNYYNSLRHGGGVIAILQMYKATKDKKYLAAAERALDFIVKNTKEYNYNGQKAYYLFFNKKAKLGGSGISLVAFMRYYEITQDGRYNDYIFGYARHLLSQIMPDGEMVGYYIHPSFNNGEPIVNPTEEEKRALFSFYYPGEALLGLALFEQGMEMPAELRQKVRDSAKKALDFLVKIRPEKYADMFEPLPSDSWLMQAIEVWADEKDFQRREYLDFVFNDAKQMISHMYTEQDSPYYDYPGCFYYKYGDHAYPDAARAEGLIAAYYLAEKTGEKELAAFILENCTITAEALMHTYNGRESSYMYKYPDKSIGSFRFKLTRHWVRIDTTQHATCFFLRLYSALSEQ